MKIEKISDYKVKITISSIDLKERKIDMADLVYTAPRPRNCSGISCTRPMSNRVLK